MFEIRQSALLDHPADVVWAYLVAFEQVPGWEHGVLEVRRLADGPPRVGDPITARRIYAGREAHLEGEIIELEPSRAATLLLRGGPLVETRVRYSVAPSGEGRSIVTYTADGRFRGPLRLIEPIAPWLGRAEVRRNLAKLGRRSQPESRRRRTSMPADGAGPARAQWPSARRSPASIRTGRRFSAGVSGHEKCEA